jgi:hypothetical protein
MSRCVDQENASIREEVKSALKRREGSPDIACSAQLTDPTRVFEKGSEEWRIGKCWVTWGSVFSCSRTKNQLSGRKFCGVANVVPMEVTVLASSVSVIFFIQ